ncbi:MAG: hypothetical protein KME13_11475 [Myxacorys californica WJT36-NPBG1]|jgi:hypothetical protein|nr:hypothetical protein [Myxacorys californica WJT36-NPBG1]
MNDQQKQFEQAARHALIEPTPAPKYELWTKVKCHYAEAGNGKFTEGLKDGQIIGMTWKSLHHVFQEGEDSLPGWTYTIDRGDGHCYFHEVDLDEAAAAAESDHLILPAL